MSLKQKLNKGLIKFDSQEKEQLSKDARKFVLDCLHLNPKKRLSAEEVLNHSWFKSMIEAEVSKSAIRKVLIKDMTDNLKHFNMMNYLQKSLLKFIFEHMSNDENLVKLTQMLKDLDMDDSKVLPRDQVIEVYLRLARDQSPGMPEPKITENIVSLEEEKKLEVDPDIEEIKTVSNYDDDVDRLKAAGFEGAKDKEDDLKDLRIKRYQTSGNSKEPNGESIEHWFLTQPELEKLWDKIEKDGFINYETFISHLNGTSSAKSEKVLKATFNSLDENNDGTVSSTELKTLLLQSGCINEQEEGFFKEIMNQMDTNMDAKITFKEFKALMQSLLISVEEE